MISLLDKAVFIAFWLFLIALMMLWTVRVEHRPQMQQLTEQTVDDQREPMPYCEGWAMPFCDRTLQAPADAIVPVR